jgi:hypothetical protein
MVTEIDRATDETESSLLAILDGFRDDILREREAYQRDLQEYVVRFDELNSANRNKHRITRFWINRCNALYEFILQEFDTAHFVPGRIEKITQRLDLARSNLDYGMPEAALSTAQMAFTELSDLRIDLEAKTLEWQNLFACAFSSLKEICNTITANSHIPALDTEGRELPILIDINSWSAGTHEKLLEESRRLLRRLSDHPNEARIEDLRRIIENDLPRIRIGLETVIYEARLHALQAQLRANIAELALQALMIQGFTLTDSGYTGNDLNESYEARLLNRAEGITVEVKVVPQPGQGYANDIIVISEDSTLRTEHELRTRFNELRSTFADYGLSIGPAQTVPSLPQNPIDHLPPPRESIRNVPTD